MIAKKADMMLGDSMMVTVKADALSEPCSWYIYECIYCKLAKLLMLQWMGPCKVLHLFGTVMAYDRICYMTCI